MDKSTPNTLKDIRGLIDLIGEGHKRILDQTEDQAILILGETGAGKSTLTYLLAGKTITGDQNDEGEFIINALEPTEDVKIGHNKASETKIPTKIKTQDGCVIWDCPGFADLGRDATQDIANAFHIQRLFDTTKELKFVLAIPEYHMMGRGADLLRIVNHFVKIFKDIDEIQNSVSLVITQASPGKTSAHFKRTLEKVLQENTSLETSDRKVIQYLQKSIGVFHKPTEQGIVKLSVKEDYILNILERNTEYVKPKAGSANVVISKNSTGLADELFNKSRQALLEHLTKGTGKMIAISDNVGNKGDGLTGISRLFQSQSYDILKTHYKELLNLESLLAFQAFCALVLKQKGTIDELFTLLDEKLSDVISILLQYYQDEDKAEVICLEYQIKENVEYMRFLSKVYEQKPVDLEKFIQIFEDCKEAIDEASLKGAESIILEPSERSLGYYQTAIRFLDLHPNSAKCKTLKAQACSYIAAIQKSEGKFHDAINSCIQSLEINEGFVEPLDLIDDICINDNAQLQIFSQSQWNSSKKTRRQVLVYLNQKNDKIFLQKLSGIKALVNTALEFQPKDKSSELMVFVEHLWSALSVMLAISNKNKVPVIQFGEAITQVATTICPETSTDILQEIDVLTKYLTALRGKDILGNSIAGSTTIYNWVSYLDTEKAANVLFDRIKTLDLQNCDLLYYEKVIKYTSLLINIQTLKRDEPLVLNLEQDPICRNKRALANYEIGKIKQNQESHLEAMNYYIGAIEINEKLEDAYRRLDEIYFITGKIVTQNSITKKLLQFNTEECSRIFNERLIKFYQDYITDRKYFTQADRDHVSYLDYLDNLYSLNISLVELDILVKKKESVKFFETLTTIFTILAKDAIEEKIQDEMKKNKKVICEFINKDNGLFTLDTLDKQLRYIKDLSEVLKENIYPSVNNWIKLFVLNQLQDTLKRFVKTIKVFSEEKDSSYYKRVINHVGKYNSDKDCVNITIQSQLCLVKRAENKDEEIQCYLKLIEVDSQLFRLCQGQDNEFYSKKSVKKLVCDKVGDIYFNEGKIEDAIMQFKRVNNYIKTKKCFDTLINSDENNYNYREQKGDYLSEKGMIDSSVECYHEALSLTTDHVVYTRINQKISDVLASVASKSEEFKRKADEVATTKISIY